MNEKRIEITTHIKCRRTTVFAAWQTAESFAAWFAPMTSTPPTVRMDFRVGGAYSIVMPLPDGSVHTTRGVFREIVDNERIVMTWRCDAFDDPESVVVVDFLEADGGTDIHLQHGPFDNDATRDAHTGGWQACLGQLAAYVAGND